MTTKDLKTLHERLCELLSERRTLRALFGRYQPILHVRSYTAERTTLESQIAAIVVASLPLEECELNRLPHPEQIAECAFRLRTSFGTVSVLDQPGLVWDSSPLPGVMTERWHPALKQRLTDLVGPLDGILERMLAQ